MDLSNLFKLSYGLYVLSSGDESCQNACIVNSLAQVTSTPPRLSVAVNKNNFTCERIAATGRFVGTVLDKNTPLNIIANFGFKSGRTENKWSEVLFYHDKFGVRYPISCGLVAFSCKVIQSIDLGTHVLFIADLEDTMKIDEGEPLTYDYYHKVKKGLTPKNAPSYQPPVVEKPKKEENIVPIEKNGKKGFKCTVCGYEYFGDELPENFSCPLCNAPRDKFVPIE